jgi:hypothetical protein
MPRILIIAAPVVGIILPVRAQQPEATVSSPNSPPVSLRGPAFPNSEHGSAFPEAAPLTQSIPTFAVPALKGNAYPATRAQPAVPAEPAQSSQPQR